MNTSFKDLLHYGQLIFDQEVTRNKRLFRGRLWKYGDGLYQTVHCNGKLVRFRKIV